MALEAHALFAEVPEAGQAEDLIAAAVGEERPAPAREPVQAAELGHELGPRAQHEVVGVGEDDLGPERLEVARGHGLHRARGADGHEGRGEDGPMCGLETTRARPAIPVLENEGQHRRSIRGASATRTRPRGPGARDPAGPMSRFYLLFKIVY